MATLQNVAVGEAEVASGQLRETEPANRAPEAHASAGEIKKLLYHSSHYLAGLVTKLGLGFIALPIFTRVFSVADYGLIDFAQKILLLMTALSKLGLQNSALRFFEGKEYITNPQAKRRYYSTMFFGSLLTSTTVAIVFVAVTSYFFRPQMDAPLAALMGFLAVLIVLKALESMLWSFMRVEERTKAYNVWSVITKALAIGAVCFLLPVLGRSPKTYFTGTTIAEITVVATLGYLLFRRGVLNPNRLDPGLLRTGLLFGSPLIIYEIASIVLDSGDRVLVRHYLGAVPLGLYSVAYGLSAQVNELLIFPLSLAIFPIYMRLWRTQGPEATASFLSTCLDLFLATAAGVCALAVVTANDAVILLTSQKYHGAEQLIPLVVAGLLVYTTHVFLCAGLLIHKKTGTMALLLLCSAALNIGMNVVLLPRMGLMAAALATLVSYVFCILLLGFASVRLLPLKIRFLELGRYLLVAGVVSYSVSKVEFRLPIVNLSVRTALTVVLYLGLLYLLDRRLREGARTLFLRLRNPQDFSEDAAEVAALGS
jgi:O-antigen/teichoic acid export membrane protein